MEKIKTREYTIVASADMLQLIKDVNLFIQDGWEICGGVSVTNATLPNHDIRRSFYQAMSKTIKSE